MAGLILAFLIIGIAAYFNDFIAPHTVSVAANFLFWWYVATSAPKVLFIAAFMFLIVAGGAAVGANLAQSRVGKFFGFFGVSSAFGGISTALCILALASNIFFILGAHMIQSSVYVNLPNLSSGDYDYSRLIPGAIAIFIGIYIQRLGYGKVKFSYKTRT